MKDIKVITCVMFLAMILTGCSKGDNTNIDTSNSKISSEVSNAYHVFSHRGASGEEEESTLAAYDLAVWYGSRWIEMDLVTSKDGTLWISHDNSAVRMTGVDKQFAEMTDDEIGELRTIGGGKILTIAEIIERYYRNREVGFNIQIRDTQWDGQWNELKAIIDEYCKVDDGFYDRLIIQAQLPGTLRDVKSYNEKIKTLFIATDSDLYSEIMGDDEALQYIDIIAVSSFYMDNDNRLNEVHDKGLSYAVYTINSTDEIQDAIIRGIDYYFTNYTAKALLLEDKNR